MDPTLDASWAIKVAEYGLELMHKSLNCDYPLPKLDIVCVPDVMEPTGNGGLVACGLDILADRRCPFRIDVTSVAEEVLLAVCYSWLSNTVTMRWWKSYWFDEALAMVSGLPKAVGHRHQDRGTPVENESQCVISSTDSYSLF